MQNFNLEQELINKEIRYGGRITNVPRVKVSKYDPRTEEELKTGGMVGGDRMLYHGYAKKYAEYLRPIIERRRVTLVEVGILTGIGLAVWCDLFTCGRIIGFDIDLGHFENNVNNLLGLGAFSKNEPEIYEFDQFINNIDYLKGILKNEKVDVVIDDGFHSDESVLKTLESFFPYLSEKFIYFVEDNKSIHEKISIKYPEFNVDNVGELTILSYRRDL